MISQISGEVRESGYLFQRCSVLVQRFNAILLHDSLPAPDCTDWWSYPLYYFFSFFNPSGIYLPRVNNNNNNNNETKYFRVKAIDYILQRCNAHVSLRGTNCSSIIYYTYKLTKKQHYNKTNKLLTFVDLCTRWPSRTFPRQAFGLFRLQPNTTQQHGWYQC